MLSTRENVHQKLDWLATFSESTLGVTRLLYSKAWKDAREALIAYMKSLGFSVYEDAAGNVFGRIQGETDDVILTGSHLDTVKNGGKYDGAYGVLAGIHAVYHTWKTYGTPYKTLEAAIFCEEEGSRFKTAYIGSRYIVGDASEEDFSAEDAAGHSVNQAREALGLTASLSFTGRSDIERFIELHIEQGQQLEQSGDHLGIVKAIVGQQRFTYQISGSANHAGTTPMNMRRDALEAAALMITAINRLTKEAGDPFVATVGTIEAAPGSVNVIPGEVTFTLDVRHPEDEKLTAHVLQLEKACVAIADEHNVKLDVQRFVTIEAVPMDEQMVNDLHEICEQEQLTHKLMYSGAGHDAQVVGRSVPAAMLFVPSRHGLSHHPDEYTEPQYLENGIAILEKALSSWAWKEK
ncbi:M20 family metallo-hydrolase [Bacillus daqingensis]